MCTALQAVASPLGHSTVGGFDATYNPRADDGIRTRDPHLGKVMRYQLRYIRPQRARSSPGAKHDDSRREPTRTTFSVPSAASPSVAYAARSAEVSARANLRPRSPLGAGPVAQWESVRFTRGRSLVRSQPGPPESVQVIGFSGIRLPIPRPQRHQVIRRLSAAVTSAVTVILRARRAHPPHDRGQNRKDLRRCVRSR